MRKSSFEEWIWNLADILAKYYHSDNGVFTSEYFHYKKQTWSFSGVGTQAYNAHIKRYIQTISYWTRSTMVNAAIQWPDDKADDTSYGIGGHQ